MKAKGAGAATITFGIVISAGFSFSAERAGDARVGKLVYQRYCVSCHGAEGDGAGEFAEWISPKPRDFRQGTFKCRSTPSGWLPTDADLEKILKNGLYGTHMPTWYAIGHRSRTDVIAYIKTFSDRWAKVSDDDPVEVPPEPPNDAASVERGRALYVSASCDRCHGERGQGDGPSAHDLKDDWGAPIVLRSLLTSHFKCGDTASDIYRVLLTGLGGTPMPSFADSLKEEEAWDLAHYIVSLGRAGSRRKSNHDR